MKPPEPAGRLSRPSRCGRFSCDKEPALFFFVSCSHQTKIRSFFSSASDRALSDGTLILRHLSETIYQMNIRKVPPHERSIFHTGDNKGDAGVIYGNAVFNGPVTIGGHHHDYLQVRSREKLISWVKPLNTDDILRDSLKTRQDGTCGWILGCNAFMSWRTFNADKPALLWLHGPPGFGKTILSASISEYLTKSNEGHVIPFFCSDSGPSSKDPYAILRSWIGRTLQQAQETDESVRNADAVYETLVKQGSTATRYALWEVFKAIGRTTSGLTFLVDGLDECELAVHDLKYHCDERVSQFIVELLEALEQTRIRILVVSRRTAAIDASLNMDRIHQTDVRVFEYVITSVDNREDIFQCSKTTISKNTSSKFDEATKTRLATEMTERSSGMFLWMYMTGKTMTPWDNERKLRNFLAKTPSTIEDIYSTELRRVLNQSLLDRSYGKTLSILLWVTYSFRPLTVREISEALTLAPYSDTPALSTDDLPDDWTRVTHQYVNRTIMRACGTLIELRCPNPKAHPATWTLQFPHSSVKEFLLGPKRRAILRPYTFSPTETLPEHQWLAGMCLHYLCRGASDRNGFHEESGTLAGAFSFFYYSSEYWYMHAAEARSISPKLYPYLRILLDPARPGWQIFSRTLHNEAREATKTNSFPASDVLPYRSRLNNTVPTPIYYAASFGLSELIQDLQAQGLDCNISPGFFGSPLHAAILRGHVETVEYLVGKGADLDRVVEPFGTPMMAAASVGSVRSLQVLLNHGAELSATPGSHYAAAPIHLASELEIPDALMVLWRNGADLNITNDVGETPLMHAIHSGCLRTASWLIEKGADLNITDMKGQTTLMSSIIIFGNTSLERVHFLVQHGADVNIADNNGNTALMLAVVEDSLNLAQLLIAYGADVNLVNSNGDTALILAIACSPSELPNFLIRHKADVHVIDKSGRTALHYATRPGHAHIITHLLGAGADPRVIHGVGYAPIHIALWYGRHADIAITSLLEHGGLSAGFSPPASVSELMPHSFIGSWQGQSLYTEDRYRGKVENHSLCIERVFSASTRSDVLLFHGHGRDETEEFQVRGQIISKTEAAFLELHADYGWVWHAMIDDGNLRMSGVVGAGPHSWRGTFTFRRVEGGTPSIGTPSMGTFPDLDDDQTPDSECTTNG